MQKKPTPQKMKSSQRSQQSATSKHLKNIKSKYLTKPETPTKKHQFMPRLKSAGLKISNTPKGGYRKINVSIDNESFNKIKDTTINFSKLNDKLEKIEQFE